MASFFDDKEFACKCADKNCDGKAPKLAMNPTLIQGLNRVREAFGKPIEVTSGYRCEAHNKAIGGAKNSRHKYGTAVDIKPTKFSKEELERLYQVCLKENVFTGLGDGRPKNFVHVDVRVCKTRVCWVY